MSETVKQVETNEGATAAQQKEPARTFSQAEVDAIIGERLAREREKYADYETMKQKAAKFDEAEEASKTELQKANEKAERLEKELNARRQADAAREIREKVSKETGVPAHLLTGDDEESCKEQAKAIAEYAKPQSYPKVRDGGEITKGGNAATRNQFADWFNEALNKSSD